MANRTGQVDSVAGDLDRVHRATGRAADVLLEEAQVLREQAHLLEQQAKALQAGSMLPQPAASVAMPAAPEPADDRPSVRSAIINLLVREKRPVLRTEITAEMLRLYPGTSAEYIRTTLKRAVSIGAMVSHGTNNATRSYTLGPKYKEALSRATPQRRVTR